MKIRSITIIALCALLVCESCRRPNSKYPSTSMVIQLDSLNRPSDTSYLYFPVELFPIDTGYLRVTQVPIPGQELKKANNKVPLSKDSNRETVKYVKNTLSFERIMKYTKTLYNFEEPILSSKYLGYDCYRLLVDYSFKPPFIVRVVKTHDSVEVITKKGTIEMLGVISKVQSTSTNIYSSAQWDSIAMLARRAGFWDAMKMHTDNQGLDGWNWILEGQKEDEYRVVYRWSPDIENEKDFVVLCRYIMSLGKINEK